MKAKVLKQIRDAKGTTVYRPGDIVDTAEPIIDDNIERVAVLSGAELYELETSPNDPSPHEAIERVVKFEEEVQRDISQQSALSFDDDISADLDDKDEEEDSDF